MSIQCIGVMPRCRQLNHSILTRENSSSKELLSKLNFNIKHPAFDRIFLNLWFLEVENFLPKTSETPKKRIFADPVTSGS